MQSFSAYLFCLILLMNCSFVNIIESERTVFFIEDYTNIIGPPAKVNIGFQIVFVFLFLVSGANDIRIQNSFAVITLNGDMTCRIIQEPLDQGYGVVVTAITASPSGILCKFVGIYLFKCVVYNRPLFCVRILFVIYNKCAFLNQTVFRTALHLIMNTAFGFFVLVYFLTDKRLIFFTKVLLCYILIPECFVVKVFLFDIIMTLALDPALCLVLCCMMPLMTVVVLMVSKKGLPLFDKLQKSVDELVRVVRENTTGVRVIKALSRVNAEKERFNEVNTRVMRDERRANVTMALTRPSTSLILNFGLVLVVVVGAHRVNNGLSEAGSITAFLTYFTIILNAMISVSRIITMSSQMIASANRIEEVIKTPFELEPLPAGEVKENAPAIEFDNVCFSYNKKRNNLDNISFTLEKGQTLGILGPTGSGKSTLASLLLRFYDIDSGSIKIDGRDIREMTHAELRQKFGVVFQNDMIFNDTIEGNIKLWRDIDPAALELAVEVAQANFIENAGGFEAEVAARGANLSGGQKQRLLIARALAGAPEVLILDDSSSALDYKTDAAMRAGVAKNFSDTTTIIIAQRVSSVRNCDKILVLESGQALGLGTHEELLETCELYREIHTLQMGEGDK